MKRNRVTPFLALTFLAVIIIFIFSYFFSNKDKSNEDVKSEFKKRYENNDWQGAEEYLANEMKENQNVKNDTLLQGMLDRIISLNELNNIPN
jgi:uncharacterized membrane protein YvbJ